MNTATNHAVSALALLFATGLAQRSAAGIIESFWNHPGNGNFHDPVNWDGPVPDESVTAIFDQDSEYYVLFLDAGAVSDRIVVRSGHVTMWLSNFEGTEPRSYQALNPSFLSPSIVVGDDASGDPMLTIVGGALGGEFMVIGQTPGSHGTVDFVSLSGLVPSLFEQWQLHVGMQGAGVLNVSSLAEVACHDAILGSLSGGEGDVTVIGDGSLLDCAGTLSVGKWGQGTLALWDSGDVTCAHAIVGQQVGSIGEVSITGFGSILQAFETLDIGQKGQGTVSVLGGGALLSDGYAAIGTFGQQAPEESGGVGDVTVSGPASTWIHDGVLYVGFQGSGTLSVLDGATVIANEGYVATDLQYGDPSGLATIDGPGSLWAMSELSVNSTLVVSDGALVIAGTLAVETEGELEGDGTLQGSVSNFGTIAPGHPFGALSVIGSFNQVAPGTLLIELGGTSPGSHDSLAVSGAAALSGALNVSLVVEFIPSAGDNFAIVSAGTLLGAFESVTLPSLGPSLTWQINQDESELVLQAIGSGDLNGDGTVDTFDFLALLGAWGPCPPSGQCPADLDGDGTVGAADLLLLLSAWD